MFEQKFWDYGRASTEKEMMQYLIRETDLLCSENSLKEELQHTRVKNPKSFKITIIVEEI
jgi:hypothetical protein